MSAISIAKQLVALCREGNPIAALNTLFAQVTVRIEDWEMRAVRREIKRIDLIENKSRWWMENHAIHTSAASSPWLYEHCEYQYDLTQKSSGKRMMLDEVSLYTPKSGKIVREAFFYD